MIGVFQNVIPRFAPIFGPSIAALNIFKKYSGGDQTLGLQVTRSLPNNVTTQMILTLWGTVKVIHADSAGSSLFSQLPAQELAGMYLSAALPSTAQTAVGEFMNNYGMRGIGETDFSQPRWRDNPTPVIHTLKSYLQIDPASGPDVVLAQGEKGAAVAVENFAAGGLITAVDGMMTHGSVVPREYGIPAVVSVDQATLRSRMTSASAWMDRKAGSVY